MHKIGISSGFILGTALLAGRAAGAVVVSTDSQSGPGPFTPTYTTSNSDLINGMAPSSSNGNFALETSGGTAVLTDGVFGTISGGNPGVNTLFATAGGGAGTGTFVQYNLNTVASPLGYQITTITSYGGWNDNGRNQQKYSVSYSTVAAPTTFTPIASVDFNPSDSPNPIATRTIISDNITGVLATSVAAVRFDFDPTVENGYVGYTELDVAGTPIPEPASIGLIGVGAIGLLARRRSRESLR